MAYNNAFPISYQPMYQYVPQMQAQPQPIQQQPQAQQGGGMIWVQGEAGAKSYLVAPNTTVQLWDSEAQSIYIKSADSSGMPTMKILDYAIREKEQTTQPATSLMQEEKPEYVTKSEFMDFVDKMQRQIEKVGAKKRIKEDSDDE